MHILGRVVQKKIGNIERKEQKKKRKGILCADA